MLQLGLVKGLLRPSSDIGDRDVIANHPQLEVCQCSLSVDDVLRELSVKVDREVGEFVENRQRVQLGGASQTFCSMKLRARSSIGSVLPRLIAR